MKYGSFETRPLRSGIFLIVNGIEGQQVYIACRQRWCSRACKYSFERTYYVLLVLPSGLLSVYSFISSAATGRISVKFDTGGLHGN